MPANVLKKKARKPITDVLEAVPEGRSSWGIAM
jgi:hypothetical protein